MGAPRLDQKPGEVYDRENGKTGSGGGANDGEGSLSAKDSAAFDQITAGIRDSETNPSTTDGQSSAKNKKEAEATSTNKGGLYNPDGGEESRRGLKRVTGLFKSRRRKVMGSIAALSATAAIAGTVITAPVFLMNHISTLIIDKSGDLQNRQSISYRRSKLANFRDNFSVEGRRSGKIIQEMQAAGYNIEFDSRLGNTVSRISANGVDINPDDFGQEISDFMDRRYKIFTVSSRSTRWKTKRMEAFYARNGIIRKPIISPDKLVADKSPEEIVNGENYRAIDGEENLDAERQVSGDPADPDDPNNTAANQEALDNASNPNDGSLASLDEQFREGVPVRETGVLGGAVRELGSGDIGPNAAQVGSDVVSSEGIASTGFAAAKGALVITDIGDKLCRVDKALELAVKTARFLNSIKLMRAAMAFVSADDGQRRNEASSELVRELLKRVTLSDATLGNFASSSGYKFAANGSYDSGITSQKGFASTRGELSENWQDVKGVTSQVPQCGLLANPLFQVGQVAGIIALTYFTAGTGTAAAGTAAGGLRQGITTVITQITTRRALLGIAGGVILDISFDQIIAIAQLYVQQQLEVPFTGQEVGGAYSAMLFSGAGVLHKQRNLTGGFVPATSAQYSAAQDEYFNTLAAERREQSFATRMLNINNDNSLAYKSFANVAFQSVTPTDSLSDGARNIASLPSLLANSVISPIQQLTGTAYAQEANFDTLEIGGTEYATDPYGNFQTIIPAWLAEYANPEVEAENTQFLIGAGHINATTLEPTSEQFTMHMDNCVDSADTITPLEEYVEGDPSDVTKDCAATQLLTRRFKGHLINLDADDVVDAALFPEEISEGGLDAQLEVGTPTTDLDAPGLNGYAIPCSGEPTPVIRLNDPNAPYADWSQRQSSGTLSSNGTDGNPINVYIREACPGATDVKTVFIASSVHGSENGGQLISHELLYNADLPDNIRIVAVPEINKFGVTFRDNNGYGGRINGNGVNLNRNFNYRYGTIPSGAGGSNYKGTSAESEPETQALVAFVQSIDIDLALHYHDNIHYVAAVGSTTPLSLAQTYGQVSPSSPLRPAEGGRVFQRGSFDGWQNETLGTPTLLIEMAQDQSQPIIDQHVSAVQAVVSGGGF